MLDQIPDFIERLGNLNTGSTVRIFTRFNYPNVVVFLLFKLLVCSCELDILRVPIVRLLDIEGQRNGHFKWINAHSLVICADVHE